MIRTAAATDPNDSDGLEPLGAATMTGASFFFPRPFVPPLVVFSRIPQQY